MDGKNSSGRRISLLNENETCDTNSSRTVRLHSVAPSFLRSRTSSYASSPSSPPTPLLVRSDSSESTMRTPSPVTPPDYNSFDVHPMASPEFSSTNLFTVSKDPSSGYPAIPHTCGPLSYPSGPAPQPTYFRQQQSLAESQTLSPTSANARSKKNSYPCPLAKEYGCNDYFTTSGHAARHSKKHTGKKDAICPDCRKAFTRKDNMEQHRRTHQSGRNASKGGDAKKAKQQSAKRPKPAPLQADAQPSLSSLCIVDPALPLSPSEMAPAMQSVEPFEYGQRPLYPDPTQISVTQAYLPQQAYGLDALAIAASGEKRKFGY